MSSQAYIHLDWDTDFFGFPVVKIIPDTLHFLQLQKILDELKEKKVRLAYWPSRPDDPESQEAAQSLGGVLVDKKITYVLNLKKLSPRELMTAVTPEEYLSHTVDPDLEKLALQSGEYSRFCVDPKIGKEKCRELYRIWMDNSVKRIAAKSLLVVKEKGQIVGVVIMGEQNGRGNIGSICVDESQRGRGLGADLLRSAHRWFISQGYDSVQAIVQGKNTGATRFYEKLGYTTEKVENYYHFWLS